MIAYGIYTVRGDTDRIASLEPTLAELKAPSQGLEHWPAVLASIAMQHGWAGNFLEAYNSIAKSGNYAGELPDAAWRNAIRWAEIGLYAAAAGLREAGDSALKRFNGLAATMPDETFKSYPMLEARLVAALASILMERPTTANNLISAVERDLAKTNDSIRALARTVRDLYVRVETGAESEGLSASLQRLRSLKMGGYAKLIEALPLSARPSETTFSSLTPTELRVLASIAHGATSREIASEMGRSSLTIDSHVKSIVRKLGCSGRRAAVAIARDRGIV